MKDSEHIEAFTRFLREAVLQHKAASEDVSMYEMQLQDIEHKLELCDVGYHETAKLGKLLKKVRQQHRVAKDMVERLSPIVDWMAKQKSVVDNLSQLLGAVRKVENWQQTRFYTSRTDVVDFTAAKDVQDK